MKPQLIFVYESHSNIIPTLAIQRCIPLLQTWGITGFGIENPSDKPPINKVNLWDVLDRCKIAIQNINNPDLEYQIFVANMLSLTGCNSLNSEDKIQALQQLAKRTIAEVTSNKILAEIVDKLKCEAFSFDLTNTMRLPTWTPEESMHARDTAMAKNIQQHSNPGDKALILVGAAHHPVAKKLLETGLYEISEIFFDDTYDQLRSDTYETRSVEALRERMQSGYDGPNQTYIQVPREDVDRQAICARMQEKLESFFVSAKEIHEKSLMELTQALEKLCGEKPDEELKQQVDEVAEFLGDAHNNVDL